MTVNDWIAAFQGMVDQLKAISDNLAGLNTGVSDSLASIATSLTALNTLGVTALTMLFLLAFIWLAYWRRTTELYVFSALLSLLLGFRWIGDDTWFILGIFCFALGLTTLFRAVMSARSK